MIVFTIYKNGGNAGVLGASFSCAVFGVRGTSGVNSGARLLGRALFNWGGHSGFRFDIQRDFVFWGAVGRAVLIECAGAFVRSNEMMWTRWIKLRREMSPQVSGSS